MLVGGSVMRGDESVVRGGGARTWSPKRHFFFLISFPETNLMGATSETQLVQVWCRFLKRSVKLRLFYFPLLLFDANNEFNIVLQNVLVKSQLRNISKVVIVIKEKWAVLSLQDFCFLQKISTQIKKNTITPSDLLLWFNNDDDVCPSLTRQNRQISSRPIFHVPFCSLFIQSHISPRSFQPACPTLQTVAH